MLITFTTVVQDYLKFIDMFKKLFVNYGMVKIPSKVQFRHVGSLILLWTIRIEREEKKTS